MKKRGFTLVELLAVIVVLAIILAISIPAITGLIEKSRKNSFASSTKLVVGRALTAKSQDSNIDVTSITTSNVDSILGVENNNFSSLSIEKDGEEDLYATIVGQGKFDGFTACGTEDDVTVEKTGEEVVCEVTTLCTMPTNVAPTDSAWFIFDSSTGTITGVNWQYYYDHQDDSVPLTFPTDLVIPSKIDGVTVTAIGDYAFSSGQWSYQNLVLPSTIKTIGNGAFINSSITSVNIPSGVETIGNFAFQYSDISCLSLPKSLISIGSYSFSWSQLTGVSTPINVTSIGSNAFQGNQIVSAKIKNGAIGANAFNGNQINDLVLGDKVSTIGTNAFYNNEIADVKIGPNIKYIGDNAFANNQIVNDLVIPSTVDYVGSYAFYFGSNATINLTVDTDLENIGDTAFYAYNSSNLIFNNINVKTGPIRSGVFGIANDVSIVNLNIGSGVSSIASCAFNGGYPIENVTINGGTIADGAFSCGYNIKKVVLGSGVTSVGGGAFANNQINSLTIDDGVTSIGSSAFAANQITTVDLPSSITSIGTNAFASNMLTSINLPSSLTTIGASTFENNQIASIDLPSSLTSIDASAFKNNQLVNLTVPTGITDLGDDSFKTNLLENITIAGDQNKFNSRWSLIGFPIDLMPGYTYASCFTFDNGTITAYNSDCRKKVDIPSEIDGVAVTAIGDNAFDGLGIKSVTIPEGVTNIGASAFANDSLSYDLTIPSSVTSIGANAFSFGSNIAIDVTINANLENTSNYSFFGYSSTNVVFKNLTIAHGNITSSTFGGMSITNLKLGTGVTSIDSCAFGGGDKITNVEIANGIIGDNAFACGNYVEKVILGNGVTSIGVGAFAGSQISDLLIGTGLTSLGSGAFAGNRLTSVDIPSNVTIIGGGAFDSNQISNLVLHNGLLEIGSGSFNNNQLTSLTIPNSVTKIYDGAFENNQLTSITIPSNLAYLGNGVFNVNQLPNNQSIIYARNEDGSINNTKIISYGGANRTNVIIPSGVVTIGYNAFKYNNIESITIANTVETIEYSAFENNQLTTLTIPVSVVAIGDDAFANNRLENITILGDASRYDSRWGAIGFPLAIMPEGAYATSCFTFDNATGVISGYNSECRKNVDIPSSIGGYNVTSIGQSAFQEKQLTSVTIPNSVTSIGERAFYGNQLTSIIIPSSVTSIGYATFQNNQLTNLTIPNSVTTIEPWAFGDNSVLNNVSIGSGIQFIDSSAFLNCPSLQTILIDATRTYLSTIGGGGYNSKWGSPNAALGCSGESLYSITNSDSNTSIASQGYNNDTIKLISNKVGQPVSSFKVNGTLTSGSTFVMPATAVTITEIIYQAASATLESTHPYNNNFDSTWTKTMTGATSLSVVFDSQTMVENGYDVIYVYDGSDNQIASYTGGVAAGVTLTVPGDTVKIRLTSDGSVNGYGFKCVITGL